MIAPWALLTVSNGVLWAWILNPTYGVANSLLMTFGVLQAPKAWLSDTFWTMNVIILADVWKTVPNMISCYWPDSNPSPMTCMRPRCGWGDPLAKLIHITLTLVATRHSGLDCATNHRGLPGVRHHLCPHRQWRPRRQHQGDLVLGYDQAFRYLFFAMVAAIAWLITGFMILLIIVYMLYSKTTWSYNVTQKGNLISPLARWLLLAFYLVFTLAPILWLFISTIQTQASLLRGPAHLLPKRLRFRTMSTSFNQRPWAKTQASHLPAGLAEQRDRQPGHNRGGCGLWHFGGLCHRPTQHTSKRTLLLVVLGSQLLPAISLISLCFGC